MVNPLQVIEAAEVVVHGSNRLGAGGSYASITSFFGNVSRYLVE